MISFIRCLLLALIFTFVIFGAVQSAQAQPAITASPASVSAGGTETVTVSGGPANTTDWVGLFPVGAANTAYVSWQYLSGTQSAPSTGMSAATLGFVMPSTTGQYQFRFFAANGYTLLATSGTVTVVAPSMGYNAFDLFLQYQGHASSGDGSSPYVTVEQAMAKKRMFDARNEGATFLRVGVTGFFPLQYGAPGDLTLWQVNPTAYWALMDQLMNDLDSHQLKIVPSFLWNWYQFPAMAGEKLSDMMTNPGSKSYVLVKQYITDFVTRYKNRPTIAFYELTNELNLGVDLDIVGGCGGLNPCAIASNYTTDQMISFASGLAAYIKSLDPTHMIESGYSLSRPSAQHLRAQPCFSSLGCDWTLDTPDQLRQNMTDVSQGFDMMSVHFYNGFENGVSGITDNERFGISNPDDAGLLETIKSIADGAGKPLYVGEYGDAQPPIATDPNAIFSTNILAEVQKLGIPFSSPWIFEYYQFGYTPDPQNNIEPGYTDSFITKYENTNLALGNPVATEPNTPQVVLTWPLNGSVLAASQPIYAVASTGGTATISQVDFLVDGVSQGSVTAPPYTWTLNTSGLAPGPHTLTATAVSNTRTQSQYSVSVTK
jgi:hypothetical protein